jgi:hypothetical protein
MTKKDEIKVSLGLEVRFTMDKDTMNYGPVKKGDKITVSEADGKAFIKNGIAEKVKGGK